MVPVHMFIACHGSLCSNTPSILADVLGELQELNTTMQPYLQRYGTLLNSNTTEVWNCALLFYRLLIRVVFVFKWESYCVVTSPRLAVLKEFDWMRWIYTFFDWFRKEAI